MIKKTTATYAASSVPGNGEVDIGPLLLTVGDEVPFNRGLKLFLQ